MTVQITTLPTLPAPNRPMRVTLTASAGNHVKLFCRNAPDGTDLRRKLDAIQPPLRTNPGGDVVASSRRVLVAAVSAGIPFDLTLEAGGRYTFTAQEIARGASDYGGGYQNSPDGAPSETILGESELQLFVGQRMTIPLDVTGDACTLALWVWDDTIRKTSLALHEEESPALLEPTTARARSAIEAPAVLTALAELANKTSSTALGNLNAAFGSIVDGFNAHLAQAGVHAEDDTANAIATGAASMPTRETVAVALQAFKRHFRNDANDLTSDPPVFGDGSANYHSAYDATNAPMPASPTTQAEVVVALADLWRSFEAHRVSDIHDASDTVNALAPLAPIPALASAYIEALMLPGSTPEWQSAGAAALLGIGFVEEALN
jgi:hypothetical protein